MTNPPSDSSSTMAEAEVEECEDILKDLGNGDTDSDDNKKKDRCDDDDDEEEQQTKLTEYHAKNYFNSTMGGKDL